MSSHPAAQFYPQPHGDDGRIWLSSTVAVTQLFPPPPPIFRSPDRRHLINEKRLADGKIWKANGVIEGDFGNESADRG